MKKFFNNIKKYYKYSVYSAKAELKSEVANSYLNYVWWFLDPICFMLIYSFLAVVVFGSSQVAFPLFVFIGLTAWDFFNKNVSGSVKVVSNNKSIVSKVYIPKYILLLEKSFVLGFKMFISWLLVIILMIIYSGQIVFSWHLLEFFPIIIVLYVVTFGISSILLHFGIFVEDLANITNIVLRMLFYLSGIFYNVKLRLVKYGILGKILLRGNPVACLINELRRIIMEGKSASWTWLLIWFAIGIILTIIGVKTIHKYENSYAKVI